MYYGESIKAGFDVANRNWQVVLFKLLIMIAGLIGLFIVMIIVVSIGYFGMGINLGELADVSDITSLFTDFFSRYIGFGVLFLGLFLVFAVIAATVSLFLFGAGCGVIIRGIEDRSYHFKFHDFIHEGNRSFYYILGFTSVIGLVCMLWLVFLSVDFISSYSLLGLADDLGGYIGVFIETFTGLFNLALISFLIILTLSAMYYGLASYYLRGMKVVRSLKEAAGFLLRHPSSLWYVTVLSAGYFVVSVMLFLCGALINFVPVVGPSIYLPYLSVQYFIHRYLGMVFVAAIFYYYKKIEEITDKTETTAPIEVRELQNPLQL